MSSSSATAPIWCKHCHAQSRAEHRSGYPNWTGIILPPGWILSIENGEYSTAETDTGWCSIACFDAFSQANKDREAKRIEDWAENRAEAFARDLIRSVGPERAAEMIAKAAKS